MSVVNNTLLLAAEEEGGYRIERSLRFRSSASAYLNRTFTSAGNRKTMTYSFWVKRGSLGTSQLLVSAGSAVSDQIFWGETNIIRIYLADEYRIETTPVYRDSSAWYHVIVAIDTTQATGSNRVRLYVNGIEVTSYSGTTISQNTDIKLNDAVAHYLGRYTSPDAFFDGYLTEINFVDGQALTPSDFGEYNEDTGVWQPKKYAGTYGTNGFYLNFKDNASTTTLGDDLSGNGNDWTTNNISLTAGATYDSMIDTPTPYADGGNGRGNYAVLNPLHVGRSTLSNGNLTASGTTDLPTIIPDSGDWYFEVDGVGKSWTLPASFPSAAGNYNFGQRPFTNTPPAGFKALNTQNLPEPTIVDGGEYFNTVLWSGTGTTQAVTGVGFAPDLVWLKHRSGTGRHYLFDIIRGTGKGLSTTLAGTEADLSVATGNGRMGALGSDGFTVEGNDDDTNVSSGAYVGWNWKANGAGVSNTDGSITSTVSANPTAGFSIVTYTGNGTDGATIGHGLGVVPKMVIVKIRSQAYRWMVYFQGFTNDLQTLVLDSTAAVSSLVNPAWSTSDTTSSVFGLGNNGDTNESGSTFVAYCFAPVAGYSAFGSYTGNGSADGPFVFLGFRPAFVMTKRTDSNGGWNISDTSRDAFNVVGLNLSPENSNAESSGNSKYDITANGFKIRSSSFENASGGTYIFMAFAENPFRNALAR
jgi:hypothetical protein